MLEELGVANALDVVNAKLSGSLFSVADAEKLSCPIRILSYSNNYRRNKWTCS